MILNLLISILFLGLGGIHFYWLFGGKIGFADSLPTNEKGERVLNPKKIDTAIVGLVLSSFGLFYCVKGGIIAYDFSCYVINYGRWIIPTIFILRAIGDFKYVGFFKRIKETNFGKLDTKLFSPLCLLIGFLGVVTNMWQE